MLTIPPPLADCWAELPPQVQEAIRGLLQQYEQRVRELQERLQQLATVRGTEAEADVAPQRQEVTPNQSPVAISQAESEPDEPAEKSHSHHHRHRRRERIRVVVNETKHRRYRRQKTLRVIGLALYWGVLVAVGALAAWFMYTTLLRGLQE